MPNRFPVEAANADLLTEGPGTPKVPLQRPPRRFGSDGLPRGRAADATQEKSADDDQSDIPSRPGKDINQPGFLKGKDEDEA